ncbi:MAG: FMN-binding protein, partial [Phycisphaerae bacterium]
LKQSWLLITAAFIFGLLLAITSASLDPIIRQNEANLLNAKMKSLIPDANEFKTVIKDFEIANTKTDIYQAVDAKGNTMGFAFIAVGSGFADKIKLVIAVDKNFNKYYGFAVLSSNETPGFGSKIIEPYFSSQFIGAPAETLQLSKIGDDKKIDENIVAITGATVSSDAVVRIFNRYNEQIKNELKDKGFIEK